ncbi:MAG: hypothetical protein ACLFUB_11715 [Cyclobacteriaceae bacterium]
MKLAIRTFLVALITFSVSSGAFAINPSEKVVKEARALVEAASPDDWHTYAEAAQKCIVKGVNMKEASQWIKKSVEIRETSFNHKVLGDYYVANRLPEQALEAYSKSIRLGYLEQDNYRDKETQHKILALVMQLG